MSNARLYELNRLKSGMQTCIIANFAELACYVPYQIRYVEESYCPWRVQLMWTIGDLEWPEFCGVDAVSAMGDFIKRGLPLCRARLGVSL